MGIYSIEQIKNIVSPIAKKHELEKVCLFGSYARGEATEESDLDFLVYGLTDKGLSDFYDLKDELIEKVKKPIDIVMADDLRLKLKLNNDYLIKKLAWHIKKDKVVIYEK